MEYLFVEEKRHYATFHWKMIGISLWTHCLSMTIPVLSNTKVRFIFLIQKYILLT